MKKKRQKKKWKKKNMVIYKKYPSELNENNDLTKKEI